MTEPIDIVHALTDVRDSVDTLATSAVTQTGELIAVLQEQRSQIGELISLLRQGVTLAGATLGRAIVDDPAAATAPAFPLDKRECFAAVLLMGFASRIQPISIGHTKGKQDTVALAFEMADMAVTQCETKS